MFKLLSKLRKLPSVYSNKKPPYGIQELNFEGKAFLVVKIVAAELVDHAS